MGHHFFSVGPGIRISLVGVWDIYECFTCGEANGPMGGQLIHFLASSSLGTVVHARLRGYLVGLASMSVKPSYLARPNREGPTRASEGLMAQNINIVANASNISLPILTDDRRLARIDW